MSDQKFFVTLTALDRVKQQISRQEVAPVGLRLGVIGAGCNGFNYKIELTDSVCETDHVFEFSGVKFIIDPKSFVFLSGATLDYEVNLLGHGFKLENPNVKSTCGCGKSFTI